LLILVPLLLLVAFLAMRDPGATMRTMPDVVGEGYQDAADVLRRQGFTVGVSFRPIAEGEPGRILATIPAAEADLLAGSDVHLIAGALAQTPAPTVQPAVAEDDGGGGREGRRKGKNRD
jgi:beta-lactam-binding protein with PASTA domain